MELNYRYSVSTIKPEIVEISSNNTVYLRKDIMSEIHPDMENNQIIYWKYQEALLTLEEFNLYAVQLMTLNAMKNVSNEENIKNIVIKQENNDSNQMIIMEAIAEIYEMITNMRQEET